MDTRRVLVTGANGFIGSHLVDALISRGWDVHALVRKTGDLRWLKGKNVQLHYGDVRQISSLEAIFSRVRFDYVFHSAAALSGRDAILLQTVNVDGTRNLLSACAAGNPDLKRFVLMSSLAACGPAASGLPLTEDSPCNPIEAYGRSKRDAEEIARSFSSQFPVTIIRPPVVYGPRDRTLFPIFRMASMRILVQPGRASRYVSMVFVKDLVGGIVLAVEKHDNQQPDAPEGGRDTISPIPAYFLCHREQATWVDLAGLIASCLGRTVFRIPIPKPAAYISAFFSEKIMSVLGKNGLFTREKVESLYQPYWICSPEKAIIELGFDPRSLEQGIVETVEWYRHWGWL